MDMDQTEEPKTDNEARSALSSLPTIEEGDAPAQGSDAQSSDVTIAMATDLSAVSDETVAMPPTSSDETVAMAPPTADATVAMAPSAFDETVAMSASELGIAAKVPSIDQDSPAANDVDPFDAISAEGNEASASTVDSEPAANPLSFQPISQGYQPYDTGQNDAGEKKSRGLRVLKRFLIVVAALAVAAGAVYGAVGFYFTSHFMPNTTVNGEEVSGMTVADLAAHVNEKGDSYEIAVKGDGIGLTIGAADIDFSLNGVGYANEAHVQIDPWKWPNTIRDTHDLKVTQSITFDQAKLDALLDAHVNAVNKDASQPKNATMKYDDTTKRFEVVEQSYGTAVDREAVGMAVAGGILTLQESVALTEEQLVQPAIWSDNVELNETIDKANNLLTTPIPLRIAEKEATTVDPARIATWLSLNADGKLVANRDEIKKWAQGNLSDFFDTVGKKNTFTRPDGKKIEVEGGTYGWILDGEALTSIVADNLEAGRTDAIDCPMRQSASIWAPGAKEWPNRYIDVDLSEQYVRMYDDNSKVIWETSCVSGNPKYGGGTSTGVSYIYDKESPMILIGNDYDHDGEPDYKTPVDYWMPFEGGQGLHDAPWRSYFGGEIYSYDGSHGCVNLPYDKAKELYGITNVGDVVVVHW